MNGLSDDKSNKPFDDLKQSHKHSGSIHSTQSSLPPVTLKFDGKVDLRRIFSLIEYNGLKFLILDCPTDSTLPIIAAEFKKYNVTDVVRLCEPTYGCKILADQGVSVLDIPFLDGGTPPQPVITKFLNLVQSRFSDVFPLKKASLSTSASVDLESKSIKSVELNRGSMPASTLLLGKESPCIAVHCVAGLGRAPLLIAIALIEHGMSNLDSVDFIRDKRRGAFNNTQIVFIDRYKRVLTKDSDKSWFKSFVGKIKKDNL